MAASNVHATSLVLDDRGLLITGPSGSGKTILGLELLHRARLAGRHAALLGDDQLLLENCGGALIGHAPPIIAGLAELRGPGPVAVDWLKSARIDAALVLVPQAEAPRLEEAGVLMLAGIGVPRLRLPARSSPASVLAAESWLFSRPLPQR